MLLLVMHVMQKPGPLKALLDTDKAAMEKTELPKMTG